MDPFRLDGQAALVTGGGSGIGFAIAQAMIEAGARVLITGRRADRLEEAAKELGAGAGYLVHDVDDLAAAPAAISAAAARLGRLDILVNNAGINRKKPVLDTTDADMAEMMQTHLFGAFALTREAAKVMAKSGGGSIIMVSSMSTMIGVPGVVAYTAAKNAAIGMMRSLAVELGAHNVRTNAIAPGWIDTAMSQRAFSGDPARRERVLDRTPLHRLGQPSDIGFAAVYLASPAARFVNGTVLVVDGGVGIGF
jgi:NAD(P)-dependent dehydrogenase (short-subunit alcohol dehydrogenase family)